MSSRKSRKAMSASTVTVSQNLPSPRKGKATAKHKTSLPGYNIPFNKFIYISSVLIAAFVCFNVYRILQWKTIAGGWSSLLLGKLGESPTSSNPASRDTGPQDARLSVENNIRALAEALGLPSRDLASAIAQAVREHLPPASLSSVSVAEATQSGDAVNILVGEGEGKRKESTLKDNLGIFSSLDDAAEIAVLD